MIGEAIRRELRRKRHSALPDRPKLVCSDLDEMLIGNDHEHLSKQALEALWTAGLTTIVTTASSEDYAKAVLKEKGLHYYVAAVYGEVLSGVGKAYRQVADDACLSEEEWASNLVVVSHSVSDVPVDMKSVLILSDNPEKAAQAVLDINHPAGFLHSFAEYMGEQFEAVMHKRLSDGALVPVLADVEYLAVLCDSGNNTGRKAYK
ncbi:hypothetical protein GF343_05450 [Candidatus Woesearchaeota archaeon]|nr:hypothetical protein [Candidatus Woesearchaeota archaeon]